MPHSHHSHSGQFCKHAAGKLEDVVKEAIRQNFEVFGLTEHVPRYRTEDLYPEEEALSLDDLAVQFDHYLDEAHRLKATYASQISILVGLETEFVTQLDLDRLEDLLKRRGDRIEYLVGSVHHVNGIPIDFDQPTFQKALDHSGGTLDAHQRQGKFLCSYFDAQFEVLNRFHPEIVGHFDLCRLYDAVLHFTDYPDAWKLMERNIIFAIEYGALFELNAAAFRKGWDTAYPAADVVEVVLKHGGRFALSDDSHGPQAVGLNYHRAAEYLRRVGVSEIWYLGRSSTPNAAGRAVCPVRLDGNWWDHSFWHGRST